MTDPEKKYDATENWGITGYCETNYACFHQELTTVEAQVNFYKGSLIRVEHPISDLR